MPLLWVIFNQKTGNSKNYRVQRVIVTTQLLVHCLFYPTNNMDVGARFIAPIFDIAPKLIRA